MPQITDHRTSLDRTVRIFDSFYATDVVVGCDQFDIVNGYFTSVCETKNIAANFTAVLFRISQQTGIDVLTLLKEIQGSDNKLQMNQTICYYLNSFKSRTSLYGIGILPRPVQPVSRNIIQ
jgi:hypothetical protein